MKKLLLSSIIMLGACAVVSAQTDAKAAKQKQQLPAAAPAIQKAPVMPVSDVAPVVASDADANAAAAPVTTQRVIKTAADKAAAVKANAAEAVPNSDARAIETKKAAAKAANAPKTGKQN